MKTIIALVSLAFFSLAPAHLVFAAESQRYEMANAKQVNETLIVGGQPSIQDLSLAKEQGVLTVISLRGQAEQNEFNEAEEVERRDMRFIAIPVAGKDEVTFANAQRLKQALDASDGKVLLHCASSNRVGALLALNAAAEGKSLEEAIQVGKAAGLASLESVVRERIAEQAKVSQ